MFKAIGMLAIGALACGWAGAAQAFEVKNGFQCRIELPGDSGELPGPDDPDTTTYDTARICADLYVSVTCRKALDPVDNPAITLAGVACQVDTDPCGLEHGVVDADLATLKIDENGLARLNCLVRLNP